MIRRRAGRRRIILGALGIILLLGAGGGFWAYRTYQKVRPELEAGQQAMAAAGQELRQDPVTSITTANLTRARARFTTAADNFSAVGSDLWPWRPVFLLAGILPGIGGDLSQVPDLVDLATHAGRLGVAFCDAVEPAIQVITDKAKPAPSTAGHLTATLDPVLDALQARPAALAAARSELAEVQAARERLNAARTTTHQVQAALDQVDRALPDLERALNTVGALPRLLDTMLGRRQPTTYLLLAQNSDELRATGGFLTSIGKMTVTNGRFDQVAFEDSYLVDQVLPGAAPPISPPADLERYMQATQWFIRDTNWAPDFPTSARAAETFYQTYRNQKVDGVVAVDQHVVQLLVAALGPVTLPGYPESITGKNVENLLRHYFMPVPGDLSDEWWRHRKDFMSDLFKGLIAHMNQLDKPQMLALALALQQGLDEKHILVTMHDAETARWLGRQGWDGALGSPPGDYLMVVDTNLGFNKVNPNIQATTAYTVSLPADGAPQATLTLTYRNAGQPQPYPCVRASEYKYSYEAMIEGCYWDLVRVYVPAGAKLGAVALDGGPQEARTAVEFGKTAFSTQIVVPPGQARTLQMQYTLPITLTAPGSAGLPGGQPGYRLLVPKQPGTLARPISVTVQLPTGTTLRQARPDVVPAADVLAWRRLTLDKDLRILAGW